MAKKNYIQFKKVSKQYKMGENLIKAADEVSFDIQKGEFAIVLGASGAGKTTVLNMLGGLDQCSSGEIIVDGKIVSDLSEKEMILYRRYDIGFIFQFYNLVPNLTAYENVELATQIVKNPRDINEVLEAVDLNDRKSNFPSQLSGGEQQRVAIARAVAKSPQILLCDEPTGSLDFETGIQILKVLKDVNEKYKNTVIVITHNASIAQMADKVIKMRSGTITEIIENDAPIEPEGIVW